MSAPDTVVPGMDTPDELRAIASVPSASRDYLLDDIRCATPSPLTGDVIPPVPPL